MKKSKDQDQMEAGRRARLRNAIDEAFNYVSDESARYVRRIGDNDDNRLARRLFAVMLRDLSCLDYGGDSQAPAAAGLFKFVEITPRALLEAVEAVKKMHEKRQCKCEECTDERRRAA